MRHRNSCNTKTRIINPLITKLDNYEKINLCNGIGTLRFTQRDGTGREHRT